MKVGKDSKTGKEVFETPLDKRPKGVELFHRTLCEVTEAARRFDKNFHTDPVEFEVVDQRYKKVMEELRKK